MTNELCISIADEDIIKFPPKNDLILFDMYEDEHICVSIPSNKDIHKNDFEGEITKEDAIKLAKMILSFYVE